MPTAPPPELRMLRFRRYRVRYIPPLARIPREVVLQYLGDDENTVNPTANFSGRPEIGTTSIAYNQMLDVQETTDPIQPYSRKVR